MADSEFIPADAFGRILSRWWIIALMAIIGGILGWVFHFFQAPVYEATAVLSVAMDFNQNELSQYEQDYAFSAAGAIIDSTLVKDQVVTRAQAIGISIPTQKLDELTFSEGKQSVWELHVRNHDPEAAAELANLWAQVANDELNAALDHAMQAVQLQVQIELLDACLPVTPGANAPGSYPRPAPKDCERYSLAEIHVTIQDWLDELAQEANLAQGILSTFSFSQTGYASIPETPVIYDQASMTLAGALIGFVISLWVTSIPKVRSRG